MDLSESDIFQRAGTDGDLLPVVNERDEPIGVMPRREVHLGRHRHRAVHVGVVDGRGRIWLQLRCRRKDTFPGYWDLSATGHVDPGETYDAAARRELREELGIEAEPAFITRIEASERTGWEFHALYWLKWDGEIRFNGEEIDELRAFTPGEIAAALAAGGGAWPMTPAVADGLPYILRAAGLGA